MPDGVKSNPFDVTKATEFTDEQIADYFVDMPGGGFSALANPRSPVPMIIRGGKGSGKTHLMRYFSYSLQKLRHRSDPMKGIQAEGYLGIYFRCGGLNAERFRNKGQTEDAWKAIFAYYMELWFGQLVLATASDFLSTSGDISVEEKIATEECTALLDDCEGVARATSLLGLAGELHSLQRQMDLEINNCALTRRLDIRIRATSGRLVFGIPQALQKRFRSLSEMLFLYLLDEYENFTESQQRYVNTLLREKELPCSFKIGGRLYGFKTFKTYSDEEEIKEGSEYELLPLDARLRDHKMYRRFAERLCARRLIQAGVVNPTSAEDDVVKSFANSFEVPPSSPLFTEQTAFVREKYFGRERPYFEKLRKRLMDGLLIGFAPGVGSEKDLSTVISRLVCPDYPILEKLNIFRLYVGWRTSVDLPSTAATIQGECRAFLAGDRGGKYAAMLEKRKSDLLAQLLRECDRKQQYLGFETFVEMSEGLPRNLLVILKSIVNWATFNGEQPFRGGRISIDSQREGVREAAEWFFDDARMPGSDGSIIRSGVSKLATLFREVRFSDKPSEKSICTFSADVSQGSPEAQRIIGLAEKWSLLISVSGGQRDRNTKRVDDKFFINSMLSPKWDLPVARGGALELDSEQINAIFDPSLSSEFERVIREKVARMSAPLFGSGKKALQENGPQQTSLLLDSEDV